MFTAALIYVMAVISPGPNFIIVSRFSSLNSVTAGFGATLGICTVGVMFSTLSLLGLAALLAQYPGFSDVATLCGSAYLLYIAYVIIKSVLQKGAGGNSGAPQAVGGILRRLQSGGNHQYKQHENHCLHGQYLCRFLVFASYPHR